MWTNNNYATYQIPTDLRFCMLHGNRSDMWFRFENISAFLRQIILSIYNNMAYITESIAMWYKLFPWPVIVISYSGILKIQFSAWLSRQTELRNRNSMTHKHFICGSLEFTMVVILNSGLSRTCVSSGVYKSFDTKWGVYYYFQTLLISKGRIDATNSHKHMKFHLILIKHPINVMLKACCKILKIDSSNMHLKNKSHYYALIWKHDELPR